MVHNVIMNERSYMSKDEVGPSTGKLSKGTLAYDRKYTSL